MIQLILKFVATNVPEFSNKTLHIKKGKNFYYVNLDHLRDSSHWLAEIFEPHQQKKG